MPPAIDPRSDPASQVYRDTATASMRSRISATHSHTPPGPGRPSPARCSPGQWPCRSGHAPAAIVPSSVHRHDQHWGVCRAARVDVGPRQRLDGLPARDRVKLPGPLVPCGQRLHARRVCISFSRSTGRSSCFRMLVLWNIAVGVALLDHPFLVTYDDAHSRRTFHLKYSSCQNSRQ